jgi:flagellar biosynthesis/type III secretory pathway protein FliH
MSADPKAPEIATDTPPTQSASEEATPVASTSDVKETKPQTATEAASTAASQAAGAAAAAGASLQSAANTARARAQQHGFYQGNIEEELGQVVKSLGSFWGGFKAKVCARHSACTDR